MNWSLSEKDALEKMLFAQRSPLRTALEKFLAHRAESQNASCAQWMRDDPPAFHRAVQCAAQAALYEELLQDLERACEQGEKEPSLVGDQPLGE